MKYSKNVRLIAVGVMFLMILQTLAVAFPSKVSFSARLKDDSGNPVNGRHKVNLQIFSDGSTTSPAWHEDFNNVEFVSGKFSVDIGSTTAIPETVLDLPQPFLAIGLDDNQTTVLRLPFTSQFYALKSKYADVADTIDWQNLPDASISGSKIATINANQVIGNLNNSTVHLEIAQINNLIASLNAKLSIIYTGNTGSNDGLSQTILNQSINNSTYAKTMWQADNTNLQGAVGVYKGANGELSMQVGSQSNHPLYLQVGGANQLKIDQNSITAAVPISGNISYANQAGTLADYSVIPLAKISGTLAVTQVPDRIDATKIGDGSISNTEFQYLDGLNNNVQFQINNHNHDGRYVQVSTLSGGGSNSNTSGAHEIGVFDEFTNSNGANVQTVLRDLDQAIVGRSSIKSMSDTNISTSPADNDLIAYNIGTGKFMNKTATSAGLAPTNHSHEDIYYNKTILSTSGGSSSQSGAAKIGVFDDFSNSTHTTVQDVLKDFDTSITSKAALSHTHDASQISSGTLDTARIPNLDASKITSGVFSADRIPQISALSISAGNIDVSRMPASGTWASSVTIKPGGGIDAGNNGTTLKCKVVQIGPWMMDGTNSSLSVPHGLPDITKIRQISVMVKNDTGTKVIDLSTLGSVRLPSSMSVPTAAYPTLYFDSLAYQGGIDSIDATNINLWTYAPQYSGGWRDGSNWHTAPNRGFITIWYEG